MTQREIPSTDPPEAYQRFAARYPDLALAVSNIGFPAAVKAHRWITEIAP